MSREVRIQKNNKSPVPDIFSSLLNNEKLEDYAE